MCCSNAGFVAALNQALDYVYDGDPDRMEAKGDAFHRRVVEAYRALTQDTDGHVLVPVGSPDVPAVRNVTATGSPASTCSRSVPPGPIVSSPGYPNARASCSRASATRTATTAANRSVRSRSKTRDRGP